MILNLIKKNFRILSFILASSVTSGVIFLTVNLAFTVMLSERGVAPSKISLLLLASLPYGFRFAISPPIKNIIEKFRNSRKNIIKMMAYATQIIMIVLLASLGLFDNSPNLLVAGLVIFILTIAASVHDILTDHVRLTYFQKKDIGIAASINSVGFRVGLLIAGAGAIYLAEMLSWRTSFIIISLTILTTTVSTIFLPKITELSRITSSLQKATSRINSLKDYVKFCMNIFKKYGFWVLVILFFSYKFSDSCINYFKPIFLQSKGVSKVDFANISQIFGVLPVIIGGIIAGAASYKIGVKNCVKASFFLQMISSLCFIILAKYDFSLTSSAIFINISTFFFGFSTVSFRTYISEQSNFDINTYTILMSFNAVFRLFSTYIGGVLTDHISWEALYFACLLSNIPGIFAYIKMLRREKF